MLRTDDVWAAELSRFAVNVAVLASRSVRGASKGLKDALPSGVVGAVEASFTPASSVSGTKTVREDISAAISVVLIFEKGRWSSAISSWKRRTVSGKGADAVDEPS
jgi:hypothetical protein